MSSLRSQLCLLLCDQYGNAFGNAFENYCRNEKISDEMLKYDLLNVSFEWSITEVFLTDIMNFNNKQSKTIYEFMKKCSIEIEENLKTNKDPMSRLLSLKQKSLDTDKYRSSRKLADRVNNNQNNNNNNNNNQNNNHQNNKNSNDSNDDSNNEPTHTKTLSIGAIKKSEINLSKISSKNHLLEDVKESNNEEIENVHFVNFIVKVKKPDSINTQLINFSTKSYVLSDDENNKIHSKLDKSKNKGIFSVNSKVFAFVHKLEPIEYKIAIRSNTNDQSHAKKMLDFVIQKTDDMIIKTNKKDLKQIDFEKFFNDTLNELKEEQQIAM